MFQVTPSKTEFQVYQNYGGHCCKQNSSNKTLVTAALSHNIIISISAGVNQSGPEPETSAAHRRHKVIGRPETSETDNSHGGPGGGSFAGVVQEGVG